MQWSMIIDSITKGIAEQQHSKFDDSHCSCAGESTLSCTSKLCWFELQSNLRLSVTCK